MGAAKAATVNSSVKRIVLMSRISPKSRYRAATKTFPRKSPVAEN